MRSLHLTPCIPNGIFSTSICSGDFDALDVVNTSRGASCSQFLQVCTCGEKYFAELGATVQVFYNSVNL